MVGGGEFSLWEGQGRLCVGLFCASLWAHPGPAQCPGDTVLASPAQGIQEGARSRSSVLQEPRPESHTVASVAQGLGGQEDQEAGSLGTTQGCPALGSGVFVVFHLNSD